MTRDEAIELAARHIYETKGDRIGVRYIGWEHEPIVVRDEWIRDVRISIDAYDQAMGRMP